jgi:hypothetical protein
MSNARWGRVSTFFFNMSERMINPPMKSLQEAARAF